MKDTPQVTEQEPKRVYYTVPEINHFIINDLLRLHKLSYYRIYALYLNWVYKIAQKVFATLLTEQEKETLAIWTEYPADPWKFRKQLDIFRTLPEDYDGLIPISPVRDARPQEIQMMHRLIENTI